MGRILVSVKSLTPEYFSYLRAYETFAPATATGYLAQPVRIEGNVTGGLGVVGGASACPSFLPSTPTRFKAKTFSARLREGIPILFLCSSKK